MNETMMQSEGSALGLIIFVLLLGVAVYVIKNKDIIKDKVKNKIDQWRNS
jgi:hypothetical protein